MEQASAALGAALASGPAGWEELGDSGDLAAVEPTVAEVVAELAFIAVDGGRARFAPSDTTPPI